MLIIIRSVKGGGVWPVGRSEQVRKSNKEAALTREAIVTAAADRIRQTGIFETSVADVMAAAGLTHGGFYKHFRNKEQLVAEAVAAAGDDVISVIGQSMAKGGLNAAIDVYLSTAHRDAKIPTCPFAALGSEMARSSDEARTAATEVVEELLAVLGEGVPEAGVARRGAIVALSTLIGAMTLARIVTSDALSAEILESARGHLRL
jgi:TetR/AcrR family transcriptional regulator, transcriptional repressor for nem operon